MRVAPEYETQPPRTETSGDLYQPTDRTGSHGNRESRTPGETHRMQILIGFWIYIYIYVEKKIANRRTNRECDIA